MERKRSRGVTVFAWLLIAVNALTFPSFLNFSEVFSLYDTFDKSIVMAIILYSLFSITAGIIAGFGILKLKEMMRKAAVVINLLDVVFGAPLLFVSTNSFRQYAYSTAVAQSGTRGSILSVDTLADIVFYTALFASLFYIAMSLLVVFFFTRPKVKEQFK